MKWYEAYDGEECFRFQARSDDLAISWGKNLCRAISIIRCTEYGLPIPDLQTCSIFHHRKTE